MKQINVFLYRIKMASRCFLASFLAVILQINMNSSLLLTNSSSSGLTSFEFQHLSQLLFDEKQSRYLVENRVASLEQQIKANDAKEVKTNLTVAALEQRLGHTDSELNNIQREYGDLQTKFNQLQQKAGYKSAFSVDHPKAGTGTTILFGTVILNIGGHYNTNTGTFTCVYAGTYFFTLNVYKSYTALSAGCYIEKNGATVVTADVFPGRNNTGGSQGASNSVILHLIPGDYVKLGFCSNVDKMIQYTSFSGFLLQAD